MNCNPRFVLRQPATGLRRHVRLLAVGAVAALSAVALGGCKGSANESSTLTVNGDVPIAYVKRSTAVSINPTGGAPFAAGGDLLVREKSSPSAPEYNVTAQFTQGVGDASDPEVSYDGKKVVFAMRCPATNTSKIGDQPACTGRWNIWEYDMSVGGLAKGTFRRITASTEHDDVDPYYLPVGRGFVFSSNRQAKSSKDQALGKAYFALDEYERERVFNLHTMDAQGGNIQQISFNQSHDRNPVVRPNGDIMFSRWEHAADRNGFTIFRVKPDGTDMFVLYGQFSPGNSFLHPRDMDPAGAYKGQLLTSLMPLQRTQEGGALVMVDAANYSEFGTPANATIVATGGGQKQITAQELSMDRGLSMYGRVTTPYPLWDGTNRVLVSWRPCEVTRAGVVVPCASLTSAELARISSARSRAEAQADVLQDDAPAAYAVYMFDPAKQTWLNVAAPPPGFMYTDPVALQPRTEPSAADPTNVDATLAAQNQALIEVRSVYDTDGLGRMGDPMLVAADLPAGCTTAIATTRPADPLDTRALVADIAKIKDPAHPAYGCSPARFVRAVRAVAPPSNMTNNRSAIGQTDFEQQQILGYAPVEPDGSFKLIVPADTPLALSIIDAEGRSFQTHTNWIQVRPGERRTCDGCHSPRRGGALNSGAVVNTMPAALKQALASQHQSGETMASLRARLDPTALQLTRDMVYADLWAETTRAGVTARPAIAIKYTGNTNPADDLATPVPVNGIINYPQHVAPIWTRDRGANTCTNCHADTLKLDLRATIAGTGRLVSYEELVVGDPQLDANGRAVTRLQDGVPVVVRQAALVETSSGAANTAGQTRKSRLGEILFGQTLLAGAEARAAHPNPPATAPDHSRLLSAAERRVVTEWMDLGGQYFNDPFDAASGVRTYTGLSQDTFAAQIEPILLATCAKGCHEPIGSNQVTAAGTPYQENRLTLTGDANGDYGAVLSMISDACNPATNPLLARPATVPHPAGATGQAAAVLPAGSTAYNTIAAWISTACPKP